MSELKPCPFCGGAPAVIEDGYKAIAVHCFNCGADITAETERKACAAWNRRAQPANEPKVVEIDQVKNEPLTLEELRGMDGEPVYLKIADGVWGLVDTDDREIALSRGGIIDLDRVIGLAYRRKPEGSENDA